jgi:hypothetical protein
MEATTWSEMSVTTQQTTCHTSEEGTKSSTDILNLPEYNESQVK